MNAKNKFRKPALLLVVSALVSGCSVTPKVNEMAVSAGSDARAYGAKAKQSVFDAEQKRVEQQVVNRPFLTGKSTALARELQIPAALRSNMKITALFSNGSIDLVTAANQISQASRLAISITPDALLPQSMFSSRVGGANAPATGPGSGRGQILLSAIGEDMPIFRVLDEVARLAGVSWRPAGGGAEFFRTETRVFKINALAHSASTSASLGRNSTANSIFDASSKTGFSVEKSDQLLGLKNTVDAMLSQGGRATLSAESQSLVVTDTPDVLNQVAQYIDGANKAMSRRVRVVLEAIEIVEKDGSEFGLDWSLVYKSMSTNALLAGANSLAGAQSATLGIDQISGKNFTGSALIVKALSEVGTVVSRKTFPFITTSGRPITQALRNTFSYVDAVQATATSALLSAAQPPTISQKEETVGTFITIVPVAKDSGQIFLSISYDVTSAEPLVPFTAGGETGTTVQQKSINGMGVVQELPLRSGQTVVIGSIESHTGSSSERRLAPGAPLMTGGSNKSNISKSQTVLLVTAISEDGF